MTNLKLGVSALVVAGATTALVVQHQAQIKLHGENESLQQQITQLHSENQQLSNLVAQAENSQSLADDQRSELIKLRDEVGRLRNDSLELAQLKAASAQKERDPTEGAAKDLLGKINLLEERLRQMPGWNIPELRFLPEKDWVRVAMDANLETDEGVREALSQLRRFAKQEVATSISFALGGYARANSGQLPTDVSQIQPYFSWINVSPVPDPDPSAINAILQRYQMLRTGNAGDLQPNDRVVAEKAPADDKYDYIYEIGLTGYSMRAIGGDSMRAIGSRSPTSGTATWQQPDSK